jgi:hypothetical protein
VIKFHLFHLDAYFRSGGQLNAFLGEGIKVDASGVTEETTAPGLVDENNVFLLILTLLSKGR